MNNVPTFTGVTQANFQTATYNTSNGNSLLNVGFFQTTAAVGNTILYITYDGVNWMQHSTIANIATSASNPNGGVVMATGISGVVSARVYPATAGNVITVIFTEYANPSKICGIGT